MALDDVVAVAKMDQKHSVVHVAKKVYRAKDGFAMGSPASAG